MMNASALRLRLARGARCERPGHPGASHGIPHVAPAARHTAHREAHRRVVPAEHSDRRTGHQARSWASARGRDALPAARSGSPRASGRCGSRALSVSSTPPWSVSWRRRLTAGPALPFSRSRISRCVAPRAAARCLAASPRSARTCRIVVGMRLLRTAGTDWPTAPAPPLIHTAGRELDLTRGAYPKRRGEQAPRRSPSASLVRAKETNEASHRRVPATDAIAPNGPECLGSRTGQARG